jgi:hypothetical protein
VIATHADAVRSCSSSLTPRNLPVPASKMKPDLLDLLPGIFLGVLIGEESHWSRRRIAGGSAQPRIYFVICECREPAGGVVEKQYLCGSEYTLEKISSPRVLSILSWWSIPSSYRLSS